MNSIIDTREKYWGHNILNSTYEGETVSSGDRAELTIITTPRPAVNDYIFSGSDDKCMIYCIESYEWNRDHRDLYFCDVRFVGLLDISTDIPSWQEVRDLDYTHRDNRKWYRPRTWFKK